MPLAHRPEATYVERIEDEERKGGRNQRWVWEREQSPKWRCVGEVDLFPRTALGGGGGGGGCGGGGVCDDGERERGGERVEIRGKLDGLDLRGAFAKWRSAE